MFNLIINKIIGYDIIKIVNKIYREQECKINNYDGDKQMKDDPSWLFLHPVVVYCGVGFLAGVVM